MRSGVSNSLTGSEWRCNSTLCEWLRSAQPLLRVGDRETATNLLAAKAPAGEVGMLLDGDVALLRAYAFLLVGRLQEATNELTRTDHPSLKGDTAVLRCRLAVEGGDYAAALVVCAQRIDDQKGKYFEVATMPVRCRFSEPFPPSGLSFSEPFPP